MHARLVTALFVVVLIGSSILLWSPLATGWPTYDSNCAGCHSGFGGFGQPLHDLHVNNFIESGKCVVCHDQTGGDKPVSMMSSDGAGTLTGGEGLGCRGCHGRVEDDLPTGNDTWGAGLRKVHANNGITVCANCHGNDPANPVAENTLPPYYSYSGDVTLTDPCDENFGGTRGGGPGLDNDGDGQTDAADPDCDPSPVRAVSWGVIKPRYGL